MDMLRGGFGGLSGGEPDAYDPLEDEIGDEPPPLAIGQDERRMQVRAYNHWASLLQDRSFPLIADLEIGSLPDFDPYSVLLDFTGRTDIPTVRYLGSAVGKECGADPSAIRTVADVSSRSLLACITDQYIQIMANQSPIGFEEEFVNERGRTVLYRGILLPFSASMDSENIELIYGVINWKELADQRTTDELMLEVDQVLDLPPTREMPQQEPSPLTEWADGPDILELVTPLDEPLDPLQWPEPAFGMIEPDEAEAESTNDVTNDESDFSVLEERVEIEAYPTAVTNTDAAFELADWLASARELAQAAQGSEDRSRHALYSAIGRAYDFSLAAADAPNEFRELVAASGLTMQDRAPLTPLVKLVFGADYDKTRLTEYATALGHAQRLRLERGRLAEFLADAPGGLKGVVNTERRLRREEGGIPDTAKDTPREALARKLREVEPRPLAELPVEGEEFTLLIARRLEDGTIMLVGEVSEDVALLEKAAKHIIG
jgi:hypothetical protein